MAAGWSLSVDRDTCIGSGMCVSYAPGTFDQDAEAKAVVRSPSPDGPPSDDIDTMRMAVEACPTGAIRLSAEGED